MTQHEQHDQPQPEQAQPATTRPPRMVALANGAVAASILVVVAAFGVAVSQSRPPAIAAFAPEVQQHPNQKSLQGQQGASALGASAPTGVPSTPTPTPAPGASGAHATPTPNLLAGRPAQLRCSGAPPRQTEDPQSPPCVQSFDGTAPMAPAIPGAMSDGMHAQLPPTAHVLGCAHTMLPSQSRQIAIP